MTPLIVEEVNRFVLRRRMGRGNALLLGGAVLYGSLGILSALVAMTGPALASGALAFASMGAAIWQRGRRDEITVQPGRLEIRRWVGPIPIGHQQVDTTTIVRVDHESRTDAMFGVVAATGPGYLELLRDRKPAATIARGLRYTSEELGHLQQRLLAALEQSSKR